MSLFVIGFCYIIPLACGAADAPSNMPWLLVVDKHANDRIEQKDCRQ
jgi:hypothetical protein